jgi:hypothetical protein
MIISVINLTNKKVKDSEMLTVIRAVNRQIKEDFEPYWSLGATLRLEGHQNNNFRIENPADMRGDAVIYVLDKVSASADGEHVLNPKGIPYGAVYLDLSEKLDEHWSATLSHEALELIADPEVNLLVKGPHPDPKLSREVFFWYEMCDAVQDEQYEIDGISVSNFVLPLYYTSSNEFDGRNDFLGTINKDGSRLQSFGINPGGYAGFYDPKINDDDTYDADNKRAKQRMKIKSAAQKTRRAARYKRRSV